MSYIYKNGRKFGGNVRIGEDEYEELYLDIPDYQTTNTDDKAIYDAVTTLGWTGVITNAVLNIKKILSKLITYNTVSTVNATKVGSYYSSGNIVAYKKSGIVMVRVDALNLVQLSTRTTVATLPEGFRPPAETYGHINGTTDYFMVESNGEVRFNTGGAYTVWAVMTYPQFY